MTSFEINNRFVDKIPHGITRNIFDETEKCQTVSDETAVLLYTCTDACRKFTCNTAAEYTTKDMK